MVRDHLADHIVVWLSAPVEQLARKAVEKDHRPLVDDHDPVALLEHQLAVREPLVLALDPLVIDVSTTDDETAAERIIAFARARDPSA